MAKSCLTLRPPWTAACQAFLSLTISWSLPKFMSITSSATLFTFCLQSFPASGSFVSWLFTSGDQNIGASASASVLPINIQGLFPLELTGLISLLSSGLSRVSSSTTIQKHLGLLCNPTLTSVHDYWKNHSFD